MLTAWFDWFYIKTPTYQLRTSVLVWKVISKVIPINFVSIAWLMNKKIYLKQTIRSTYKLFLQSGDIRAFILKALPCTKGVM